MLEQHCVVPRPDPRWGARTFSIVGLVVPLVFIILAWQLVNIGPLDSHRLAADNLLVLVGLAVLGPKVVLDFAGLTHPLTVLTAPTVVKVLPLGLGVARLLLVVGGHDKPALLVLTPLNTDR